MARRKEGSICCIFTFTIFDALIFELILFVPFGEANGEPSASRVRLLETRDDRAGESKRRKDQEWKRRWAERNASPSFPPFFHVRAAENLEDAHS